ncbi:hypothetical protein A3D05_05475 [Candidatus Gottesmanbacteria bacterium RIFCSPHIGHO2_02_FULL_40_24]|uniref:Vitamin K epoxide reductase domain-containing protein n=1 Tax=Candidatus Gottesmanbacteria bacterium RIFCSPHIGHO2_01_FULL_40_15 TaxID=1798376 RepID=A0A1F5Z6T6_9BACT|nr:MAG: hypothetical protein A2777_02110 [Candidatus Gottesmanbacteria bacterium RIFCSPHIGHO2_01_FULL_40_15]OGG16480.1 MAG: hypothetical protein A3D05_05475 [Candidatus Gottesmanbacteria bacterium RIFCSPHIGHO2_02_FULL_40_24]OGG25593.1 MAG: hypothetical protein A3E42_04625 [Candidatus Gottesmanbacteria bacterium RIFCSPHIGHO2_12_FULL_40_13]
MAENIKLTKKVLNRIVFILSIIGVIIAVYVLYGFIKKTSIVCVNEGCEIVRKSPYSYPLGIPVPLVGLIGYFVLMILTFARSVSQDLKLLKAILAIAVFGVLFVGWFTYTEIFYIKAVCTWCAISALNMLIIFIIGLKMYQLERRTK